MQIRRNRQCRLGRGRSRQREAKQNKDYSRHDTKDATTGSAGLAEMPGWDQTLRRTCTGNRINELTNASAPPTAIPNSRNGRSTSQTNGQAISATSAMGQHSTSRMHHSRNLTTANSPFGLITSYASAGKMFRRDSAGFWSYLLA